jgi:hypothetical protein
MKNSGAKPFYRQLCRKPRAAGLLHRPGKCGQKQKYGNL